ncbi:MAG TPA: peptide ABC transporter substrate-binding protein [Steroidobacteraceae bacterium]|nr:peptide ABC transporter substrate-binding protein [Steroidobacteraceae bacterium]
MTALRRRAAWASVACLIAGCGSVDPSTTAPGSLAPRSIAVGTALAAEQTLGRALDDTPRSLDPQLSTDVQGQRVLDDLFEGLTTVDIAGKAAAGVASSWESSADGKTWVFHLRPEARWSNGAPLTAGDFVYSWRRLVNPKTGAEYAQGLAAIDNALAIASGQKPTDTLGVEALDEHTLRVRLSGPTPYLLDLLSQQYTYPVYEPAITRYGDAWVRPEHLVCNGPFVLRENVLGSRITLEKNGNYWDSAHVRLQRVVYYILTDTSAQASRFLAGDVAWTDSFPPSQRSWLKSVIGDQVVNSPYFGNFMLGMNLHQPPFKDNLPLRRALVLALDRAPLARYMREGVYQPAYTLMPPLPDYQLPLPDWTSLSTEARHALARQLYAQAGYSDRHPLRLDIDETMLDAGTRHFFDAVAANWRSVLGAEIHIDEREFKVLLQDLQLHKLLLFHDAWIGDYPDPYTFMQIFYTGNGNNHGGYSNPRFDQLIDAAGQEPDNSRRFRLFEQAERLLDDDAAFIPLYYYATRHLVKPYLRGWQSNIMDRNLSRYMYLLEHQER